MAPMDYSTVEQALMEAVAIEDAADRAERLHKQVLPQADALRRQVINARAKAVSQAKRGNSYSKLAKRLGCSKPLIQQLAAAGLNR